MKIVIIGTRGFPNVQGGVEKHCEFLATNLVRLGCEVTVFRRAPYVDPNLREYQGVKLVTLPAPRIKSLETIIHTFIGVFAAIGHKPNILHFQAIGSALFIPMARILGFKVVLTTHGSNYKHEKWGWLAKLVFRIGESLGIKYAHKIIAVSKSIKEEMERRYGREIVFIPNGIEGGEIFKRSETLKRYSLEEGKYILSVGRFVKGKGFENLIHAFLKTRAGQPFNWRLVIVGDADHEDDYSRELKEQARQTPGVVLTGFLTGGPLAELYSHAGLFVLPSYYEGLSLSLLEAMSYGLSCVVSDIPANREVGLPEERLFKAGDIEALAEKIRGYMNKRVGEGEKKKQIEMIRERYDWRKIAETTMGVYEQVRG